MPHLAEFLTKNQDAVLKLTEDKTLELAAGHPSSTLLKEGLPIFYQQVISIIRHAEEPSSPPAKDVQKIAKAADRGDEPAMAEAAGQPEEARLAKSAGDQGLELLRLGYTLSHVVHAYGAMCQAITEIASKEEVAISARDFHALNRCLDAAIAGAVTEFQSHQDAQDKGREGELRPLAPQMRSAVAAATSAFQQIQKGIVGVSGSTSEIVVQSLQRLEQLIDASERRRDGSWH